MHFKIVVITMLASMLNIESKVIEECKCSKVINIHERANRLSNSIIKLDDGLGGLDFHLLSKPRITKMPWSMGGLFTNCICRKPRNSIHTQFHEISL